MRLTDKPALRAPMRPSAIGHTPIKRAKEAWLQGRLTALPAPYRQWVFTLPRCFKEQAQPKSYFLQGA